VDLYRGTETLPIQQGAPWYLPLMAGPRRIQPNMPGIDPAVYASYEYTTPIVDMKVYLPWLLGLAQRLGAVLIRRRVDSLASIQSQCDAVINCTGLGARWLVPDAQVKPLVGILVCVERSSAQTATLGSNFHRISLTDGEVAYIYPRRDMVVLGSTYLPLPDSVLQRPGALDEAVTPTVLQDHGKAIVGRCALLDPSVSNARVLGAKWGARPYRPEVRCELDDGSSLLVHNYGHGGQGVLLSWGSAMEASRLLWSKLSPLEPVPSLSIFQLLNSASMSKL
jgi:D-amino-acid oxidase